ncbi:pyridoxine/pyridoxamine 5'-phosphate oxidase [Iodidimonas gelatinilytica]|uniref:Pyridoxine/pyridoxamine 5'-phosphate oxidase n=1 Tax=Iodidimonas gelatinilytica TaxID=1236966 RepID=A0A5A7MQD4_9PROT|nr:pyridoxine/pyridoxamine 5'-phosphate oxidase [Iodidimonas gelatinilytica]GEQ99840.1 pyridoxine/pyridoxamine 5'-phosphate oxidase [Iodidimonas gelatinilytica]
MVSDPDPFEQFGLWFAKAHKTEPDNPNAMTLATVDQKGCPSARTVLLKEWDADGFVFYTNLHSRKGQELAQNPHVALLFYWKSLARQIRIEGRAEQVPDARADRYFKSRPRESQIGAWASAQSQAMPGGRGEFERAIAQIEARFKDMEVPRPPHWSGMLVRPNAFEFWEEGAFRLHHRTVLTADETGGWTSKILYP